MPDRSDGSLPPGRSTVPLGEQQIVKVSNTLLGYERDLVFEHDPHGRTRFVVALDESGTEYGKVYFGPDIFPGPAVHDPTAALSMAAAAAHEVSHYHRWNDRTELPLGFHTHLDEALTSLDAATRFPLSNFDTAQLIRDAVKRLQLHRLELEGQATADQDAEGGS